MQSLQQQHESMNISSVSTHQAQQQQQQQQPPPPLPQQPAAGNVATIAHPAISAQMLYDLYRQATHDAARAHAHQSYPGAATPAGAATPTNAAMAAAGPASTPSPADAKEHQRQQIINHVNALIDYCQIPQKNRNERITSVRQCSSSFFVLLCQRLFKQIIPGIDIYPNTPEKKRKNVELVLEELRKRHYNVEGISAEEVVQLNETHLSRLILMFVGIAQEDGMSSTANATGDPDKFPASPQPLSTPHGSPAAAAGGSPGYTIAEVPTGAGQLQPPPPHVQQSQQHFSRQGVVTPSGQVITQGLDVAGGGVGMVASDPAAALSSHPALSYAHGPMYFYPHDHHILDAAGHGVPSQDVINAMNSIQHYLALQPQAFTQGNVSYDGADVYGNNGVSAPAAADDDEEQPSTGYEEGSQRPPEEQGGGSLYEEDDDMLTRVEFVKNWYQGVVTPVADSPKHPTAQGTPAKASTRQQRRHPLSALLEEVSSVRQRLREVECSANERAPSNRRPLPRQKPSAPEPPSREGDGGTIPTPSSSLTSTPNTAHSRGQRVGERLQQQQQQQQQHQQRPVTATASASATGGAPPVDRLAPSEHPSGAAPTEGSGANPARGRPRPRVGSLAEPPLTRVECRLLASHPNRLIDADARDSKIERLRAARFLGDMQSRLRQRMRTQYDSELSGMREELKLTIEQAQRDKVDFMRRVRDENGKYKDAYASLMESAANDVRVPRYLMSSHTAQHAQYYADSLRESRRMCEQLQWESERRTLADLVRYAKTANEWRQRMPV